MKKTKHKGRWKPGVSGNPEGRPKGSKNKWNRQLDEAIEAVQKEQGIDLMVQAVRMAYGDAKMMAALLKKILPDKRYVEADIRSIHDDWIQRLEDDETDRERGQGGDLAPQTQAALSFLL